MARLEFLPRRPVFLISEAGPTEIAADQVSSSKIGRKALGLSALPSEWELPFFVVSADCFEQQIPHDTLNNWVSDCRTRIAMEPGAALMVRSSGTVETMRDRGSLISTLCKSGDVVAEVEQLRAKIPELLRPRVHWIVQKALRTELKGHLSNERRVCKEPRDWRIEFEPTENLLAYAVPIGIRTWREGSTPPSLDLQCASEAEITLRLRQVAKWATEFSQRIHFEWVWDGEMLWIVQADAAEPADGVDPTSVLPLAIPPIQVGKLEVFRPANPSDYRLYGKLRNAALYKQFGYEMPPFFLLSDPPVIARLLSGEVSPEMKQDLTPDFHFHVSFANLSTASDAFIYAGWKALKTLRRSTPHG